MTNTERIQANNAELREAIELAESLPDAGTSVEVVLQSKTVTPTKSAQEVTADDGYTALGKVTVEAISEAYIVPEGALDISANGEYDAAAFEKVTVNVPIPDGYIKPNGTLEITENGIHDVAEYAAVNVNVEGGGGSGESGLPAGYRRCDYIQFSGTQLVDTGVIGTQDTQIWASFTWESSTQRHLYGCASSDNTKSITSYMNGSWRFGNKYASKSIGTKNPMLPYSVLVNKTTIDITNSVTTISGVNDFETVGTLLLGGARDSDGTLPGVGINGKVYRFCLWQSEQLVLNLIPVTDGTVYRFWDVVNRQFYDSVTSTPLGGGTL